MSEKPPTVARVIRAALIILPFGTILLGALSFVFYFNQKEKVVQRSIKYAAGLRVDLNEADQKHYEQVITESEAAPSVPDRARVMSAFLESTLGPENMGYEVRQIADRSTPDAAAFALDVEITGTRRARDVVLVITDYLSTDRGRSAAALLGAAHSLTGSPKIRTIRLAALKTISALDAYQNEAISAQDRLTHVILLGAAAAATDAQIIAPLHLEGRGTVILRPDLKGDPLPAAKALLTQITDLADRL